MIQISHEFPKKYYLNGFAEQFTDYDYILVHRYLEDEEYRNYAKNTVKKGRTVYLDNSLAETGFNQKFTGEDYANAIKDLQPTYYILPDIFNKYYENIDSQLNFYNKYGKDLLPSKPIIPCHGTSPSEIMNSFKTMMFEFPEDVMFALPYASAAWENKERDRWFLTEDNIKYVPLRQAWNRKKFIRLYNKELSQRKWHLLGCKSIAEFDKWGCTYNKDFIVSVDTSLPVALSFENKTFTGTDLNRVDSDLICLDTHFYKPDYKIDSHFNDTEFEGEENLIPNIIHFRNNVSTWSLKEV